MKYLKRLIVTEVRSIFLDVLKASGKKACFLSSGQWVSQESFVTFMEIICQVDSKRLFKTGKGYYGDQF